MNKPVSALAVALTALFQSVAGAAPGTAATCTWKGPASGGNWSNPNNWAIDPAPADETAAKAVLSSTCAWVFNGSATVVNDLKPLCVGTFKVTSGTVTLEGGSGSSCVFEHKSEFTIEAGAKVVCNLTGFTGTGNNENESPLAIFLGAGTFELGENCATGWNNEFQPCASSTVRVAAASGWTTAFVRTWNAGVFDVFGDLNLGHLFLNAGTTLRLSDGKTLLLTSGEPGKGVKSWVSGSKVEGTGSLFFSGGSVYNIDGNLDYTGALTLLNGTLNIGAAVSVPRAVEVRTQANGVINLAASQTLGVLSGGGSTGGIRMADGTTLTVAGDGQAAASQFDARISGSADFVKDGANYALTLTGDNDYKGATRVAAGTLELKRPAYRPGLVAQWSFDDPDNLGRDAGATGVPIELCTTEEGGALPTQVADGVGSRAAIWLGTTDDAMTKHQFLRVNAANLTALNGFSKKSAPFAVSFWMKPDLAKCNGWTYVFRRGNWSVGNEMMLWLYAGDSTFRLSIDEYGETDATLNIQAKAETVGDGKWHHVVAAYADRKLQLWYDGELLGETTTSRDLVFEEANDKAFANSNDKTLVFGHPYAGTSKDHHLDCGFDEICVWNRALSAADVAREYALGDNPDAVAVALPEPIAHWRFDDANDLGKDEKGASPLAVNEGGKAVAEPGAHGSALSGSATRDSYPVGLPVGKRPFSVAIRLQARYATDYGTILAWGDLSKIGQNVGTYFRMRYSGSPRRMEVWSNYRMIPDPEASEGAVSASERQDAWANYVITCNPQTYVMRIYRDGRLIQEVTDFWADIPATGGFCINTHPNTGSSASAIDDVRLYACELTPQEARAVARSLKTGIVGPVLPSDSAVTVAAGATLAVSGAHVASNALSGEGTVAIAPGSRFGADWSSFSGKVTGRGELVLTNEKSVPETATVETDVSFANGTICLSAAMLDKPFVRTTGRVILPKTGTLAFAADVTWPWNGSVYKIAECAGYAGPRRTTGWALPDNAPANAYGVFRYKDGVLWLELHPRGGLFLIR